MNAFGSQYTHKHRTGTQWRNQFVQYRIKLAPETHAEKIHAQHVRFGRYTFGL